MRFAFYALLLSVIGLASSSESHNFAENNSEVQKYTDVIVVPTSTLGEEASPLNYITPYTYEAVMAQNSNADGTKAPCWRCSSPCSQGFCCDDTHPQCCINNGVCKCCKN